MLTAFFCIVQRPEYKLLDNKVGGTQYFLSRNKEHITKQELTLNHSAKRMNVLYSDKAKKDMLLKNRRWHASGAV